MTMGAGGEAMGRGISQEQEALESLPQGEIEVSFTNLDDGRRSSGGESKIAEKDEDVPLVLATNEEDGDNTQPRGQRLVRMMTVLDGVGVTMGIMVGSGIYASPGEVVNNAGSNVMAIVAWICSGILVLMGALCYAELGTTYPNAGGDSWYLTLAFGEWAGFAYTWTSFFVLNTGSQAIISIVGASYLCGSAKASGGKSTSWEVVVVALIIIWFMTLINTRRVRMGLGFQNFLLLLKCLLLVGVILMGFTSPLYLHGTNGSSTFSGNQGSFTGFASAMVGCLWAFDGWADISFLGEEMNNPQRTVPAVVALSVSLTLGIFVLTNIAYMMVLSKNEMADSDNVAMDFAKRIGGAALMGALGVGVGISAMGSVNGSIITGARVYYANARDGRFPSFLGRLSSQNTPANALIAQGLFASLLLLLPGASFSSLLHYFAPASWLFYSAVGLSVIVLRAKNPDVRRPFECPLYPLPPLVLTAMGLCLVASTTASSPLFSFIALAFVAISFPVHYMFFRSTVAAVPDDDNEST
mmetsp:Transcript_9269/g.13919  ORF Transcript_9269/g.13919 Transcript_9269/m.13919 type:complete len:526 (-) Transcript_9269:139-1716(-)